MNLFDTMEGFKIRIQELVEMAKEIESHAEGWEAIRDSFLEEVRASGLGVLRRVKAELPAVTVRVVWPAGARPVKPPLPHEPDPLNIQEHLRRPQPEKEPGR